MTVVRRWYQMCFCLYCLAFPWFHLTQHHFICK
jgi:hypothetical protein